MFDNLTGLNLAAVGVATLASFILGALWFAVLLAQPYRVALGRQNAPPEKPAPIFLVGPLLCGLVTVVTSAVLLRVLKVDSLRDAVVFGATVGFGYLAATTVNTAINPNIPRPLFYGLISGSYFLLSSVVVAVILVAMR